jgi:hypothetical protein
MSLIIVETAAEQPLTDEFLHDADQRVLPCLEARNATWHYSLLACDRDRMICTFQAPDAASVRESYRKAGLSPRPIWTGTPIPPPMQRPSNSDTVPSQANSTVLHVMEGTYPSLSESDWNEISHQISHACNELDVEWLRSYLSLDRTKLICELKAADLDSAQEIQRRADIPFDRVWAAQVLSP